MGAIALRREIRGTVFGDIYTDIDIANCHPSLVLQIAHMYEIDCPELTNYVTKQKASFNISHGSLQSES